MRFWGLGNLVLIYPLIYKIKERFPEAQIAFVTFDANKGFLEKNKAIDEIIYFKFTTSLFLIIKQFTSLVAKLRKEKLDLLINFETFNNAGAFFSYLTKASLRVGLTNFSEGMFYTHPVKNDLSKHISGAFSDLLRPLGINSPYQYYNFRSETEGRGKIESLLKQYGVNRFICVHPGTSINFIGKRYREEQWSSLVNLLIDRYGLPVFFTGTEQEKNLADAILARVQRKEKVFNLAGKLTLWEFVEFLRKSFLLISSDTGSVHFAASLGVNVAVFYGPTSPRRFGSLSKNSLLFYQNMKCSPCVGVGYLNRACKNKYKCLDFSPREILSSISERFFDAQKN